MSDGYDRYENESGAGGFMMGLLTGTVLGAGLGMLFAPRAGSELRGQLSEQANNLSRAAADQYRRATEGAGSVYERGREAYDQTREQVSGAAGTESTGGTGSTYTGGTGTYTSGTGAFEGTRSGDREGTDRGSF